MRLLLDEHLPEALARALRAAGHDAVTLAEWQNGEHRSAPDSDILAAALHDDRILVSGDVHSLPDILKALAEEGRHHAGVILVSSRSIRHDDVRTLFNSLQDLLVRNPDRDWKDYFTFLRRVFR